MTRRRVTYVGIYLSRKRKLRLRKRNDLGQPAPIYLVDAVRSMSITGCLDG